VTVPIEKEHPNWQICYLSYNPVLGEMLHV